MINSLVPKSIKELRAVLGLISFYHAFIKNYASISFVLTELLEKDSFSWNSDAQNAFNALKVAYQKH